MHGITYDTGCRVRESREGPAAGLRIWLYTRQYVRLGVPSMGGFSKVEIANMIASGYCEGRTHSSE